MALQHMMQGQLQVSMSSDLSPLVVLDAVPSPLLLYRLDLDFRTDLGRFHWVLRSREAISCWITSYTAYFEQGSEALPKISTSFLFWKISAPETFKKKTIDGVAAYCTRQFCSIVASSSVRILELRQCTLNRFFFRIGAGPQFSPKREHDFST